MTKSPPQQKRGPRRSYTPETVDRLCEALRLGSTVKVACQYDGIAMSTFYHWLNTKPEFKEKIEEAESVSAVAALAVIQRAAREGDWRAGAWLLKTRYGYVERVQHSGDPDQPVEIKVSWDD